MRHETTPATNNTIYRVPAFCAFAALLVTGFVGVADSYTTSIGSIATSRIFDSHAADHLLAPPLQAGLQRFVKPWWKTPGLVDRRWPDPPVPRVEALLVRVPGDA